MPVEPRETPETEAALRHLEERLARASEAAERLFAQAAGSVVGGAPSQGYQATEQAPEPGRAADDLALLLSLLDRARDAVPPELRRRLAEALRELLIALRAVIDWCVERLERRRREPLVVHDIPIS